MSETVPPPVAPVEGHYARLRNGDVIGPMQKALTNRALWTATASALFWTRYGRLNERHFYDEYDIIATISPADMQAVASGELERLRAALSRLLAACEAEDAWSETDTTKAFDRMIYEYERAQDEARTALQGDAP